MAKKKDDDDNEDRGSAATARDIERVRAGAKEAPDDHDDGEEVDLDAAPDDDKEPEPKKPRSERRQERGEDFVRQANERAEAADRRAQALEARLAAAESRLPKEKPADDPAEAELKQAYDDQKDLYKVYQAVQGRKGGATAEEIEEFQAKGQAIERRKMIAAAKIAGGGQRQGASTEDVVVQVRRQQMAERNSDIVADANRLRWAQGRMQMELAEGKPDTEATVEDVMEQARRKFGLPSKRTRPAPSAADKRRLGGMGRGGGSSDARRTLSLSRTDKDMADAAFPHVKDERKRHEMWARGAGRKLQDAGHHD